MARPPGSRDRAPWAALLLALLAVPVLWLYRDVVPLDVAVRLLLPLLWLTGWTLAALGAGLPVWRLARGDAQLPPPAVLLALGAAVLALLPALLALVGWLRPAPLAVVLLAAASVGLVAAYRHGGALVASLVRPPKAVGWLLLLAAALVVAGLSAPPIFFDSLNYHLAFPALWLRHGGFVQRPDHFYSYYPAAVGMLYSYPLALVGPWATRAVHAWLGLVAVLAAGDLGRRAGGERAAAWAMALFGLTPAVLDAAGYALSDLGLAAWAGAALWLVVDDDGWRRRPTGTGALLGLLTATAVDAKYLALVTVAVPVVAALVVALAGGRAERRASVRLLIAGALTAVLVLAPWLGRNMAWTGNPFYPYLRAELGGPPAGISVAVEVGRGPGEGGPAATLLAALTALPVRTFAPLQVAAVLGPLWLLLLPAAALVPGGWRWRSAALWAAALAGLLAWGALAQLGRYLLPVLVAMSALAGVAASVLTGPGAGRAVRWCVGAVLGVGLVWNASTVANALSLQRFAVAIGVEKETRFLADWVSYWPLVDHVNHVLPRNATVLLVGEPRAFYLEREVLLQSPDRTPLLVELARRCPDVTCLVRELKARGVTHILVNEAEMAHIARMRHLPDYWAEADAHTRELITRLLARHIADRFGRPALWVGRLTAAAATGEGSRRAPAGGRESNPGSSSPQGSTPRPSTTTSR